MSLRRVACSALLAASGMSASAQLDGNELYRLACWRARESELARHGGFGDFETVFARGLRWTPALSDFLDGQAGLVAMILEASKDTDWDVADAASEASAPVRRDPYGWVNARKIMALEALRLAEAGHAEKGLRFLQASRQAACQALQGGVSLEVTLGLAGRRFELWVAPLVAQRAGTDGLAAALRQETALRQREPPLALCWEGELRWQRQRVLDRFGELERLGDLAKARDETLRRWREGDERQRGWAVEVERDALLDTETWRTDALARVEALADLFIHRLRQTAPARLESVGNAMRTAYEGEAGEIPTAWRIGQILRDLPNEADLTMEKIRLVHARAGEALTLELTRRLFVDWSASAQAWYKARAWERLLLLHMAGDLHARRHGREADNLEALLREGELPAEIAEDPFFPGAPFRLAPRGEGKSPAAYSVGPDGIDDGGQPWDARRGRGDLFLPGLEGD